MLRLKLLEVKMAPKKINEEFIPLEDLEFIEQYNPKIVCTNNVWGLTNDYLYAIAGRMAIAKKELQSLSKQLSKVTDAGDAKNQLRYGKVVNWRTGKFEELIVTAATLEELKGKVKTELLAMDTYLELLEVLLQHDYEAFIKG